MMPFYDTVGWLIAQMGGLRIIREYFYKLVFWNLLERKKEKVINVFYLIYSYDI